MSYNNQPKTPWVNLAAAFLAMAIVGLGIFLMMTGFDTPMAGAFIVIGGLACTPGMPRLDVRDNKVTVIGCCLMLVMCGAATFVCFQQASFINLFPGIPVALAAGQLFGMLAKSFFPRADL